MEEIIKHIENQSHFKIREKSKIRVLFYFGSILYSIEFIDNSFYRLERWFNQSKTFEGINRFFSEKEVIQCLDTFY